MRRRDSSNLRRLRLVIAGSLIALAIAAEQTPAVASEAEQADMELNQTYQQLMQMLPGPAREQLRESERAWLTFTELNKDAFQTTAGRLGLSSAELKRIEVAHVMLRVRELGEMLQGGKSGTRSESEDRRLNIVYQQCIAVLTAAEAMKLRKAQRAWISFREACRPLGAGVWSRVTSDRTDQLNNFYLRSNGSSLQAGPSKTAKPESEDESDPSIPDPFEKARKTDD
jgi:uncharacterized protein YecT (DUF1311 family)